MSLAARTAILKLAGGRRSDPWSFTGAYAMISAVVALAIIAIAGEALFDFARCDIRGWLGSSFFATLCLAIAVTGLEPRSLRIATAALALGFTVLIVAAVPSPEHAYLGGVRGMNAKVMMAAGLLPAALSVAVILNTCAGPVARRRGARWGLDHRLGFGTLHLADGAGASRHHS